MKKIEKIIMISFFIVVFIPIISIGKYCKKITNIKVGFNLAEPIIEINSIQNTIKKDVIVGDKIEEFYFNVRNYKKKADKIISEVKLSYNIEIKISNNDCYGIEYKLYDCENGEEVLKGKNITENIIVDANVEYEKQYKLIVKFNKEIKTNNLNIDVVLNSTQEI